MHTSTSELLLTCPHCGTCNFLERGLRAHNCKVVDGPLTAAWLAFAKNKALGITDPATGTTPFSATVNPSNNKMNQDNNNAIALIGSADLRVKDNELELLKASAAQQFSRLRALRNEEALRGLLLGLTLHRIKASMAYGDFGGWAKQHATFGERWTSYLMKLAVTFVTVTKATKPELLALPGDQTELRLEDLEGAQRSFYTKASKFVADQSLNELLGAHGIKEQKKLGGTRELSPSGEGAKPAPTPEQLAHSTRDEIGSGIERLEQLLIKEARLAYVAGDHDFLRGVAASLGELALKVDVSVRDLIAISRPAIKAALTVNV